MTTRMSCILLLLTILIPTGSYSFDDTESPEALNLYMRVQREYLDLKKDESRLRDENAWRNIINSYQVIVDSYPNDRLVDDITFLQGNIYRKMYEIFGNRQYLHRAVSNYRTVLRDYPSSFLQQAALYAVAEVQETHLQNPKEALETYNLLLDRFPKGYRSSAARQRLDALHIELGMTKAGEQIEETEAKSVADNVDAKPEANLKAVNSQPVAEPKTENSTTNAVETKGQLAVARAGVMNGRDTGKALINDIRSSFGKNSGRVTIEVSSEVRFKYEQLPAPNRRIFFDLHNVDLSRSKLVAREIVINNKYLQKIRIAQFSPSIARVVLDFDAFTDYNVFTLPGPDEHFRIVFDLYNAGRGPSYVSAANNTSPPKDGEEPPQTANSSYSGDGAKTNSDGKYSLSRQLGAKIKRVIIDPGHGGKDPGAIGYGRMTEKELNLDVAKRLQGVFKAKMPGVEAVLTRENDAFIELDQRPAISKAKEGDLFISIHSNSTRKGRASGIETYYLNFASDKEAEQLAAKENALSRLNQAKLRDLITRIATNNKKEESKELALFIQNNLYQQTRKVNTSAKNRGVRSAPFVVLIGTNVPSVLVEIGFINHAVEGKLLSTPTYRDRIADGLFYGIKAYIDSLQ
jgi:N-acetylmuramoyl-L-alanine amidase